MDESPQGRILHALSEHDDSSKHAHAETHESLSQIKKHLEHGPKFSDHKYSGGAMNTDHVTVNTDSTGRHDGGGMGLMAAMLANRGVGSGVTAALGAGAGAILGEALGLGGRRGRGGDDCCNDDHDFELMEALGDIKQEIAEVGSANQIAISNAIYQNALASCAANGALNTNLANGFASVQASIKASETTLLLQNAASTSSILTAIKDTTIAELNTKNIEQNARIVALENNRHLDQRHAETTLNIHNTNTNVAQAQALALARQDESRWAGIFGRLDCVEQHAKATSANTSYIVGNQAAVTSGAQTSTPTAVNTKI